jgi:Domain of unknown function (DUF4194)
MSQPLPYLPYAPVILKLLQGAIYSDDPHWDRLQSYLSPIKKYFADIGLQVQNYEPEGFAYLSQPDPNPEDEREVLPRLTFRRQLSFKVTVLCVLLREELRQFDASDATGKLFLSIEKFWELLQPYLSTGNNEEKFRKEVDELLSQVVNLGFLKSPTGQAIDYEVRPILKAKIDAEMLEQLKQKLEIHANSLNSRTE